MKTFTMEELCNAFEIMQRADRTLKSSSLNGRLVLERMILKLCDAS
jgi:DNA polymerase III delta subunit